MGINDEISNSGFREKYSTLKLVHQNSHFLLFFTICVISIITFDKLVWSDPGFYLPNQSVLLHFIPDPFIGSIDTFETRFSPQMIYLIVSFYLGIIGILYHVIKSKINFSVKLFHVIITSSLVIIFFITMIEDELVHEAIDSGIANLNYFDNRYKIFLPLIIFWLLIQICVPIIYLISNNLKIRLP